MRYIKFFNNERSDVLASDPQTRNMRREMQTAGVEEGANYVIRIFRALRIFFNMCEFRLGLFEHFPINDSTVFFLPFRTVLQVRANGCVSLFRVLSRDSVRSGDLLLCSHGISDALRHA